jgi:hypothetical protein
MAQLFLTIAAWFVAANLLGAHRLSRQLSYQEGKGFSVRHNRPRASEIPIS